MEGNICDINHLDSDVLLPPRKRFLAGFKKQSSNGSGVTDQPIVAAQSPSPSPSPPSASSSSSSDYNSHLSKLLSSNQENQNLSPEEIAEASRAAATAAAKAAEVARAKAEEKAVIAAKAVAAAKSALDLVASFSQEMPSKEDRYLKKNKLKKHVPVQLLYKKHGPIGNNRTDEDLARRLHRVINSSPRISSNGSELKGHKHKRPKSFPPYEKAKFSNGYAVAGVIDSEDSTPEASMNEDTAETKYGKISQPELGNGEAESSLSKEKATEDSYSYYNFPSKKRGRVKLKTVPLSICYPKEAMSTKTPPLTEKKIGAPTPRSKPLLSLDPSSVEAPPVWKCQEFKAPACIKQNKVMQ